MQLDGRIEVRFDTKVTLVRANSLQIPLVRSPATTAANRRRFDFTSCAILESIWMIWLGHEDKGMICLGWRLELTFYISYTWPGRLDFLSLNTCVTFKAEGFGS